MRKTIKLFLIIPALLLVVSSFAQKPETVKVTFIELGSVRCIPCQKMQKVIKQVEEKYPTQVKTIFYDVWTDEGKEAAKNFEFNLIPTQIFFDEYGKEYARHEGYLEFSALEKILKQMLK